jgi:hypothetical protein
MTKARIPKSRMTRKCHVRFGSGSGVGDRPADHDLGCPTQRPATRENVTSMLMMFRLQCVHMLR